MYRVIGVIVAFLVTVPLAFAETDYLIVRDVKIGGFPRDGVVAKAIEVFGEPTDRQNAGDTCLLRWPSHGIVMNTYYLNQGNEGPDPCGPQGRHTSTTVTDRRWRTSAGLKIGDSLGRLRGLYRKAKKDGPSQWRLTTRSFVGLPFPGLEARLKNGRVVSFTVFGPRTLG